MTISSRVYRGTNTSSLNIKILPILIIFLLFLSKGVISDSTGESNSNSQADESSNDKFAEIHGFRLRHLDGIPQLLNETDMTHFVYYYKKTSPNSKLGAEFLTSISKKLLFLANIILVDCDEVEGGAEDHPMCKVDPRSTDGYPRMEIYIPPELKVNPYTKQVNSHERRTYNSNEVSENSIYNFITQNILSRSTKLNSDNFDNFANNQDFNKVILFTDKSKTPLLFRGLSNFFYDRLLFGEVEKDQTALIKKFKVTKFPTLMVYQTHEDEIPLDEAKTELYKGEIKAEPIVEFLNNYGLKETLTQRASRSPAELKYKIAFKNLDRKNVMEYINKFNNKRFVVYLNNGEDIPEDVKKFNMMSIGFFHFININCKKDQETENFCKNTFRVSDFPSLALYKNVEKDMKKSLEKRPLVLANEYHEIDREVSKEYPSIMKEANPQTFASLLTEVKLKSKVPFVYLHEGEIPLGLHLLANEDRFNKFIEFIVYEHPPKDLMNRIRIKKLPQLIILLQQGDSADQ